MTCVCRKGNPCLWHYMQVRDGIRKSSEVPFPRNYRSMRKLRKRLEKRFAP